MVTNPDPGEETFKTYSCGSAHWLYIYIYTRAQFQVLIFRKARACACGIRETIDRPIWKKKKSIGLSFFFIFFFYPPLLLLLNSFLSWFGLLICHSPIHEIVIRYPDGGIPPLLGFFFLCFFFFWLISVFEPRFRLASFSHIYALNNRFWINRHQSFFLS